MIITMIAAVGKNLELGCNNDLIWKLKSDLLYFKEKTYGHIIVMGRKTYESLPKKLSNRKYIVITKQKIDNVETYDSIEKFLGNYRNLMDEVFIIGGESIYRQFLELSDKLYLTEIDATCPTADTYFPHIDENEWKRKVLKKSFEKNIKFDFVEYERK